MKVVILLAIIATAFAADVCLPSEFTAEQAHIEPEKDDVYVMKRWFSLKSQRERIDVDAIFRDNRPDRERFSWIFDHPAVCIQFVIRS